VTTDKLQNFTESKNQTPQNKTTPKNKIAARIKSPLSLALSLLLQQPQLIHEIENPECLDAIELSGVPVLRQLIKLLKNNSQLTTGAILEYWREEKHAERLAKLAAEELMTPSDGFAAELNGALNRIVAFAQEEKIQILLKKAEENNLTQEEKIMLQHLLLERQA